MGAPPMPNARDVGRVGISRLSEGEENSSGAVGTTLAAKVRNRGNTRAGRLPHVEQRVEEGARLRRVPPAGPGHAAHEAPLAIDEVDGGWSPHAVDTAGDV